MSSGIMLDAHGTLLDANAAWVEAFAEIDPARTDYYRQEINRRRSRHELAREVGVEFEEVVRRYQTHLTPRPDILAFVRALASQYPIVIVSNAPRARLLLDLEAIPHLPIRRVYSAEDGRKPQTEYLERILLEQCWSRAILIGNDPAEDESAHPRVRSIIIPYGTCFDPADKELMWPLR